MRKPKRIVLIPGAMALAVGAVAGLVAWRMTGDGPATAVITLFAATVGFVAARDTMRVRVWYELDDREQLGVTLPEVLSRRRRIQRGLNSHAEHLRTNGPPPDDVHLLEDAGTSTVMAITYRDGYLKVRGERTDDWREFIVRHVQVLTSGQARFYGRG